MIRSSGLQAASAVIHDGPCFYWGASVVTDDTKDVILTVWDSPNSTTTNDIVIDYLKCSDETLNVFHTFAQPVHCPNGLYAALDAAEGDYVIYFSE